MNVVARQPFSLPNIADLYFKMGHLVSRQTRELPESLLTEMNAALRFANPYETKIEPMAFADPQRYAKGDTPVSKPGIFGKILKSFLDERINLFEFGRLITKFSESCTKREWLEFFKPVLEQRLLYPSNYSWDEWWMKIDVPVIAQKSYSIQTLPQRFFLGTSTHDPKSAFLTLKIGKGECHVFQHGRPMQFSVKHDYLTNLKSGSTVYGVEAWTDLLAPVTKNIDVLYKITDIYLWEDKLSGDLRIPYEERRSHLEILVNEDISILPEEFLATPDTFHRVARIFFEQRQMQLTIRDADSTRYEQADLWRFLDRGEARVIDVVGDSTMGMDHYVVEYDSKRIQIHQGTHLLTFNHRRKIYQQRDEIIGKYVDILWAKLRGDGTPDYAILDMNKSPLEESSQ